MKWLVFVLMIGFVGAVDVELSCPEDVFVDEEFECELEIFDGDGIYDVKVEVDSERNSILRIFDSGDWKSSYYYLKEFARDDAVVLLKILERGRYDVVVKLRQGNDREDFDAGKIRVEEGNNVGTDYTDLTDWVGGDDGVIVLGGNVVEEMNEEWDYVSRDGKIVDWLLYGFCLFLILLVGLLMWSQTV